MAPGTFKEEAYFCPTYFAPPAKSQLVQQIEAMERAKDKAEYELGQIRATLIVNADRGQFGGCSINKDDSTLEILLQILTRLTVEKV